VCGPIVSGGNYLGEKTCSCNQGEGVYNCAACAYESPLPACESAPPAMAMCLTGTENGNECTTPCEGGSVSGVCTIVTDGGKMDGCVCIERAADQIVWSCAAQWW
jgi:hypothetical protein